MASLFTRSKASLIKSNAASLAQSDLLQRRSPIGKSIRVDGTIDLVHLDKKINSSEDRPKWAGRVLAYTSRDSKRAAKEVEEYELKQSRFEKAGINISKERQIEAWKALAERKQRQRSRS